MTYFGNSGGHFGVLSLGSDQVLFITLKKTIKIGEDKIMRLNFLFSGVGLDVSVTVYRQAH